VMMALQLSHASPRLSLREPAAGRGRDSRPAAAALRSDRACGAGVRAVLQGRHSAAQRGNVRQLGRQDASAGARGSRAGLRCQGCCNWYGDTDTGVESQQVCGVQPLGAQRTEGSAQAQLREKPCIDTPSIQQRTQPTASAIQLWPRPSSNATRICTRRRILLNSYQPRVQ
jgi:hypothetical protein